MPRKANSLESEKSRIAALEKELEQRRLSLRSLEREEQARAEAAVQVRRDKALAKSPLAKLDPDAI